MRTILSLLRWSLAVLLLLPATAFAQADLDGQSLDELFNRLKNASNEEAAHTISDEIWERWTMPDDPALASRMRDALQATQMRGVGIAIEVFTGIIEDYPDYAEGWNQRATLYYVQGEYEKSLADIEEVLAREPRHYGALAGRTLIYLKLDAPDLALQSIKQALKYHPYLNERHLFPQLMEPPTRI